MFRYLEAAKRMLRRKLRAARLRRAHAWHRAQHPELYAGNDEILSRYRAGGGLSHGYQNYKLAALRAVLRERQPKVILELGSGSTTSVFADYVRRTPGSRLICVDESDVYLKMSQEIAGIEDGDPRFTLERSDHTLVRNDAGEVVARRYLGQFDGDYDLVFVDGPSATDEQGVRHKQAPAIDILDIVRHHAPRTILVDGKFATVATIQQNCGDLYNAFPSELKAEPVPFGYRYLSSFHLKEPGGT